MWSELGTDGCGDAGSVLPPPRDQPGAAGDELWHTATFAAITDRPPPRRRLRAGLVLLGLASVAVCGYAGIQLAVMTGFTPPSPPRYVIPDQTQDTVPVSSVSPERVIGLRRPIGRGAGIVLPQQ